MVCEKYDFKFLTEGLVEQKIAFVFSNVQRGENKKFCYWKKIIDYMNKHLYDIDSPVYPFPKVMVSTLLRKYRFLGICHDDEDYQLMSEPNPYGFDDEQILQVVQSLASFHASSILFLNNHRSVKETLRITDIKRTINLRRITTKIERIAEEIDGWSHVKWSENLSRIIYYAQDLLELEWEDVVNVPLVINFGCLSEETIAVKHEGNGVWQNRFLLLNPPQVTSPALDLIWYIFTDTKTPLLFRETGSILELYVYHFREACKLLGLRLDYFDANVLWNDIKRRSTLAILLFCAASSYQTPEDKRDFLDGMIFFEAAGAFR